jgi:hypothetical protein
MTAASLRTAKLLADQSRQGQRYDQLGAQVTLALLSQPRWITRTVESIRFVDRNVVSRRVVRHFAVPREEAARPYVDERYVMPVFAVQKGEFISCDLHDGAGHLVTLAPLQDRCKLSYLALLDVVRRAGVEEEDTLYQHLWNIVESPHAVELADLEGFLLTSQAGRDLMRSKIYGLFRFLCRNYLIYRSIPEKQRAEDHVLTMRLERRVPDTRGDFERAEAEPPGRVLQLRRWLGVASHEFRHEFIQSAGSTHIEVEAPDGIALGWRQLDYLGYGVEPEFKRRVVETFGARGTSKRRARFLVPRSAPPGAYAATIHLRPGAGVMRDGPQAVAGLLLGLLLLVIARRSHINQPSLIDAAATLLLVLPALVALVAARPAEHPRVTRVIVGPRILALTVVPLAAIAAYTLITAWPTWVLWALAGASAVLMGELFWVYFLARYSTRMATADALYGEDPDVKARRQAAIGQAVTPVELPEMTRIG